MHDAIQRTIQSLAYSNALTKALAVFCAAILVFLLMAAWLVVVFRHRGRVSVASTLQTVLLFGVSYVAAKAISHGVSDPRPYIVQHIQPLMPLAHDNGFPSDHSLLAWAMVFSLLWLAPAAVWPFVLGALLVMLGRLGVGAHHTVDVTGSAAIVFVVAGLVALLRWPAGWRRPIFADRRWPIFLRLP
ncbi:MAG TPA: phosphatase PAP2 family protein [Chloroflexota bacterium]|jgi:undecaprenyl-diphosphatase|nr:phosphatase PAP2 family protein [Chloroflexota bacterium]